MLTRAPCTWHYRLTTTVSRCCCCLYIVCSTLQELGLLPLVFSGLPHLLLPDVLERLMDRHAFCELSKREREREWNSRLLDGQTSANSVSTTRMLQALECGWASPCSPVACLLPLPPAPAPWWRVSSACSVVATRCQGGAVWHFACILSSAV